MAPRWNVIVDEYWIPPLFRGGNPTWRNRRPPGWKPDGRPLPASIWPKTPMSDHVSIAHHTILNDAAKLRFSSDLAGFFSTIIHNKLYYNNILQTILLDGHTSIKLRCFCLAVVLHLFPACFTLLKWETSVIQPFFRRGRSGAGDGAVSAEGTTGNRPQADQGGIGVGKGRLRGALLSSYWLWYSVLLSF